MVQIPGCHIKEHISFQNFIGHNVPGTGPLGLKVHSQYFVFELYDSKLVILKICEIYLVSTYCYHIFIVRY